MRALILRARRLLDEPAMGLAAGMRQGPVSCGLTGLAMLTCETVGKAIAYGLGHQHEAGAMMQHLFAQHGPEASIELVPHDVRSGDRALPHQGGLCRRTQCQSLHAGAGHPTPCGGIGLRASGAGGGLHALFPLRGAF
ncbi:transcriptional regulator, AraC family [Xanthomonas oryzae pv. oryzae PXO99A]|uniref:Transcriptional regulator, AraC family n=1 Tax=Xanthomonas oryzae pv. oryzae (strain PXO99A) TaxID=360094 RepID=A0A0K0GM89_XANOP|nr:transcriptional regulator, AraC family [Xanthomonas oryzae pv. oryzae PXO99A]